MAVAHLHCPSRTVDELRERIAQFDSEIIPAAKQFQPQGEGMPIT